MPIEIRELSIRTCIRDESPPDAAGAAAPEKNSPGQKEDIVAACVEQVLQILKDKEER
jgi:hypothetical protein